MPEYNQIYKKLQNKDFISHENKKLLKQIIRYELKDKVNNIIKDEIEHISSYNKKKYY